MDTTIASESLQIVIDQNLTLKNCKDRIELSFQILCNHNWLFPYETMVKYAWII